MAKEKKVIFSEEIDSIINGLALGISFVVIALFVWFGNLFHNRVAESVFAIALLLIGICGTFLEIERANKELKGIGNFGLGVFISVFVTIIILKFDVVFVSIFCLVILLFGVYAMIEGILEMIYSLKIQKRQTGNRKIGIFQIVTGVTEIIALIVVILQLIAEIKL